MSAPYERPAVDGPPVCRRWRLIAAETDGVPAPASELGRFTLEVERWFSMRADAAEWVAELERVGFTVSGPTPLATRYHGPTDSPSNAWATHAELAGHAALLNAAAAVVNMFVAIADRTQTA